MKAKKHTILAISGSTKKGSTNEVILQYIARTFNNLFDVVYYDSLDQLPHFNPDLDSGNPPAVVQALRASIASADGVLFCTPEYVFSLPGSLKNLIEWCVSTTVFTAKPTALLVAAASGQKAFESLELIMQTLQATIAEGAKLVISGAKGKVNADGEITHQQTKEAIAEVMQHFAAAIDAQNAASPVN